MNRIAEHTRLIRTEALKLGFDSIGISKAEFLEDEAPRLENWLKEGMHGEMSYMERNFDKRLDPRKLVDGAKSVVSLLLNYYPSEPPPDDKPKISRYARGKDYHFVIKDKLKVLLSCIREFAGDVNGRAFVDSAPVLDRAWAMRSGLGWVGKNTNLIHPKKGSYFFIAELIIDLELEPDGPIRDHCGTCTKCIDACPTDAIIKPYVVDGSRCISYFTIELKDQIPEKFKGMYDDWIFGCDICQEVCPWNRFSLPAKTAEFSPGPGQKTLDYDEWNEITEETFDKIFGKTPLKRAGYDGLKRNLRFISKPGGKLQ